MFGIRFIKVQPTTYLLQYQRGRVTHEGAGLSFFYYGLTTSLVAIPTASTEESFIFEETTADFQRVTFQPTTHQCAGDESGEFEHAGEAIGVRQ